MGENKDSFFDRILLKNISEKIPIDAKVIETSAKNSPSTTKTNIVYPPKRKKANSYKA